MNNLSDLRTNATPPFNSPVEAGGEPDSDFSRRHVSSRAPLGIALPCAATKSYKEEIRFRQDLEILLGGEKDEARGRAPLAAIIPD